MIAIIDYGMGNVGSIANMLRRLEVEHAITSEPELIELADRLVLPGVGAFSRGMRNLRDLGIVPLLERRVLGAGVPVLGICLGMQLLARGSEEGDPTPGLGWLAGDVVRLPVDSLPVPHMGWNDVVVHRPTELLPGTDVERYYFVHSFHVVPDDPSDVVATTNYQVPLTAAVQRGNVAGVQFHPEKSHRYGMELLRRFAGASR